MKKLILFSVVSFLAFVQTTFANKKLTDLYLSEFKDIAIQEMRITGIPASIKLAQGLLESNFGRSDLASKANNHFGIKCGKDWSGPVFYKHDDESNADGTLIESCFRAFPAAVESYKEHSSFLTNPAKKSRYGFLFEYPSTDYISWANGLKFAGYATDPKYPDKLIKLIETYQLYKFDEPVFITKSQENVSDIVAKNEQTDINSSTPASPSKNNRKSSNKKLIEKEVKTSKPESKVNYSIHKVNNIKVVIAIGGERLESLAKNVKMDVFDLMEYNELYISRDYILKEGSHVYLQKKKRTSVDNKEWHKVNEGETMFSISQQYGIKLESLHAKNNLPDNAEPMKGERISLKKNISKKETPKYRQVSQDNKFLDMGDLR